MLTDYPRSITSQIHITFQPNIPSPSVCTTLSTMYSRPLPELDSFLVVGGCGFLGHHIVKALLAHPSKPSVSVVSRNPTVNLVEGASYHTGDITNITQVHQLIRKIKPRVIINSVSTLPPIGSSTTPDPKVYFNSNVRSIEAHGFIAWREPSVYALVHSSSVSVVKPDSRGELHFATEDA